MGLNHPEDLIDWRRWQDRRHRLRRLKRRVRPAAPRVPILTRGSDDARILIVAENLSPSNVAALLGPLAHLPPRDVAVLSTVGVLNHLPAHPWTTGTVPGTFAPHAVVAAAHHSGLGRWALELAQSSQARFVMPQHGLLTPHAPPLPAGAHLLAWSQADADFWWSGRDGRSTVIGSQLLWEAGADRAPPTDDQVTPTYLGQLHGAELPRRRLIRAAGSFCQEHGATYRPHPSETDRLSRFQHARWERRGVRVDCSGLPLRELASPVVSVFSTGVLEAAARGIPAWVDYPDPPPWLLEFWDRYEMRRYGGAPTPAPTRPVIEPARAVADILRSYL